MADGTIEQRRRAYAEMLRDKAGLRSERLVRALAEVPREAFLGPGPWRIIDMARQPHYTPDAKPAHLYQDALVTIDTSRNLNNGMPSGLTRWIDALDLREGDLVAHAGCGPGYYTALMAMVVGATGRIIAYDVDADLAARAKENLAPYRNVEVLAADASKYDPGPVDAMLINAGATYPLDLWIDSLKEGGRLMLPLVRWPSGAIFGNGVAGWGAMMRVRRLAGKIFGSGTSPSGRGAMMRVSRESRDHYAATFIAPVGIYPCLGALDRDADRRLEEALKMPAEAVRSLRREQHAKEASCWLHGAGYCFSKNAAVSNGLELASGSKK